MGTRRTMMIALTAALIAMLVVAHPSRGRAAGVVTTCNEASFDAAMTGGGAVTFACSGTIAFTSTKVVVPGKTVTVAGAGNSVALSGGGAVRLFRVDAGGTLQLSDVTLMNGSPALSDPFRVGGAIANSGALTIIDSRFQNNSAAAGGAIQNSGTLTVQRSQFAGNSAKGADMGGGTSIAGDGGAIANHNVMNVSESSFAGNWATYGGGAVANWAAATITSSTFDSNSSNGRGGAIANYPNPGSVTVVNSTFAENSSAFGGGAIENHGTAVVINNTLSANNTPAVRNFAGQGFAGHLTLANTIVSGSPLGCFPAATVVDAGGNLVEDGSCGFATGGDPRLGALRDNGGPTPTMAITRGSPAFGMGVLSSCNAPHPFGAGGVDQRGEPRTNCSAGAFEPAALAFRAFLAGLSRDGP